jgi:hypothetical protein
VANPFYTKRKYYAPPDSWLCIKAPWNCNYFGLKNLTGSPILLRTDAGDEETEDALVAYAQEGVTSAFISLSGKRGDSRFREGDIVVYVKSSTADPLPLLITWLI